MIALQVITLSGFHCIKRFIFLQDNASRVSVDTIQKVLKQMDSSIKNLEMDIKNATRSPIEPDDR
jgi:hypothetical protein